MMEQGSLAAARRFLIALLLGATAVLTPGSARAEGIDLGSARDRPALGRDARPTPGASDSTVVMTTVSMEGVLFLHREREAHPYFLAGFGHASPDIVDKALGAARADEGLYLVAGAGFERFMRPRLSLDFTLRGYGMISNSEFTSFAQICAGIHLY